MIPVTRKRSVDVMQRSESPRPVEYNDEDYAREVLQLEHGQSEAWWDSTLLHEAENLGLTIPRLPASSSGEQNVAHGSMCESADSLAAHHVRTASSGSEESAATSMTSSSSMDQPDNAMALQAKRRATAKRSMSFGGYEKYLADCDGQEADKARPTSSAALPRPTSALSSVSTRRSYSSIKVNFKYKFRLRRSKATESKVNSCICCRDVFKKSRSLQILPCGHSYCDACLRVLTTQACTDETKMPPRCCSIPIPGSTIKSVLTVEEQQTFLQSVLQFSTPWEARIFCPNPACGDFIPKRNQINPKHPLQIVCRKCGTSACSTCKRAAHAIGQDCPADWELDAVLQMGEKSGWRRCYKCRTLVELNQGCSHITCRCKAQFCYICGAVWDPVVGCPNYCNGEEELERRRLEEETRMAEAAAEKAAEEEMNRAEAAEKVATEKRTLESGELNALRARQINERDRFSGFERKMKWLMWTRHGHAKLAILDRYDDLQEKMRERHAKTATHLEDRQVHAEMELRASLKQAERSVRIRLKHMEAYCAGFGRSASGANPARVVTERDRRELDQQYNIRDGMERLHQSKINVMRDKQAKQMEQLLVRQEEEFVKLSDKQQEELEALEECFGSEEDGFAAVFAERRARLRRRWMLMEEVERKKLEVRQGVRFAPMTLVEWPGAGNKLMDGLEVVAE